MANQPRADNPNRNIRIPDSLWTQLAHVAETDGVTPSVVVRTACEQYARRRAAANKRRKKI